MLPALFNTQHASYSDQVMLKKKHFQGALSDEAKIAMDARQVNLRDVWKIKDKGVIWPSESIVLLFYFLLIIYYLT